MLELLLFGCQNYVVFGYWDKMREIKGVACCKPAFSDFLELKELKNVEVVVERF